MRGSVYMVQKKPKILHGCAYVQPCKIAKRNAVGDEVINPYL